MALVPVLPAAAAPLGAGVAVDSLAVSGGTLLITTVRNGNGGVDAVDTSFIAAAAGGAARYLALTSGKAVTGVPMTATATGGAFGIARTAGTSLMLVGEATSANSKTDGAMWELNLPSSYVADANIAVTVNAAIAGTGTLTANSCLMAVAAYTEINGTETALTVSAAGTIAAAGSDLAFTITGTGLTPGAAIAIQTNGTIVSSSGANTLQVRGVKLVA